jgi:ceramide glucosyltransferase
MAVLWNPILAGLALLSLALTLWQWLVARRFPLHRRLAFPSSKGSDPGQLAGPQPSLPALTLLKPLKGCDPTTEASLRSWFVQDYTAPVQILFGVASPEDPVCAIIDRLRQEFPASDAQLVVCNSFSGANAKVATLAALEPIAKHDILVISDADVRVPVDFLANIVSPLRDDGAVADGSSAKASSPCGLVNCFYRLANLDTLPMKWEAVAVNADFWSQVLQSQSLKPLDFALGAVMATRRRCLEEIGGFASLLDFLADDYVLGNRIARRGHRIVLSPIVAECWSAPMGWAAVWRHQLRWARTVRVCKPAPYFFSILSNATLWPLLWLAANPTNRALALALGCMFIRVSTALNLQNQLAPPTSEGAARPRGPRSWAQGWLVLMKDLLQVAVWFSAFTGNHIEWRGQHMLLRRDGTLEKPS